MTRPYPHKCGACREPAVWPVRVDYRTELQHDGRLYPVAIDGLVLPVCAACGETRWTDDADELISHRLRSAAGLLQPDAIRRERTALGLTADEMAAHLGVGVATLARWESGGQIPTTSQDRRTRMYLTNAAARGWMAENAARSASVAAPTPPGASDE